MLENSLNLKLVFFSFTEARTKYQHPVSQQFFKLIQGYSSTSSFKKHSFLNGAFLLPNEHKNLAHVHYTQETFLCIALNVNSHGEPGHDRHV